MSYSTNHRQLLRVPTTRADSNNGYTRHCRLFNGPYAWIEQIDSQETQAWIAVYLLRLADNALIPVGILVQLDKKLFSPYYRLIESIIVTSER